jgi:hypothetical protein
VRRREFITLLSGVAAWPLATRAQQRPALPVIGLLQSAAPEEMANRVAAFRKALSENGYEEGRNLAIEYRWARYDNTKLPELAAELVRRRVTNPVPTGSAASKKTIGITEVTSFAAAAPIPCVRMTSTLRRTNSAAISEKRSVRPSAHRWVIATVRPSIQPSSLRRCTKLGNVLLVAAAEAVFKYPITGIAACCARDAIGHAAAPPSSVMNSRLFNRSNRIRSPSART